MILTKITRENADVFRSLCPKVRLSDNLLNTKFVIGALTEDEHKASGLMIFDIKEVSPEDCTKTQPVIRLLWIYVDERMRLKGIGRMLMQELFRISEKTGLKEVSLMLHEWSDTGISDRDEAECAKRFFRSLGFCFREYEEVILDNPVEDLIDPMKVTHAPKNDRIVSADTLSEKQLKSFFRKCAMEPGNGYDDVLSSAIVRDNGISGMLFIYLSGLDEGFPEVDGMVTRVLPGTDTKDLKPLYEYSLLRIMKVYGPDVRVTMRTHDLLVADLIKTLLPGCDFDIIEAGVRRL